jgi:hypothetical protein
MVYIWFIIIVIKFLTQCSVCNTKKMIVTLEFSNLNMKYYIDFVKQKSILLLLLLLLLLSSIVLLSGLHLFILQFECFISLHIPFLIWRTKRTKCNKWWPFITRTFATLPQLIISYS